MLVVYASFDPSGSKPYVLFHTLLLHLPLDIAWWVGFFTLFMTVQYSVDRTMLSSILYW